MSYYLIVCTLVVRSGLALRSKLDGLQPYCSEESYVQK